MTVNSHRLERCRLRRSWREIGHSASFLAWHGRREGRVKLLGDIKKNSLPPVDVPARAEPYIPGSWDQAVEYFGTPRPWPSMLTI